MDAATADTLLLVLVVVARFVVPLFIPAYPLPAVVLCLLLDGADREILVTFTDLDLSGYQGTDKALDIFYLTVAMLAVLRNWTHAAAARTARLLYYLRLLGVAAFELTGWRPFLLLLPNAFEYFFIFYEAVRLFWDPRRMSKDVLIGATAFIWIFIKLPQEWWIHVAKLDFTDFVTDQPMEPKAAVASAVDAAERYAGGPRNLSPLKWIMWSGFSAIQTGFAFLPMPFILWGFFAAIVLKGFGAMVNSIA